MSENTFLKVMFGTTSGADANLHYKIGEVNIAKQWNSRESNPELMGGFNFSTEESIFRWLIRGNTLYDVMIPPDAEIIRVNSPSTPGSVYRSNKIVISNPRCMTDDIALELYRKSVLPDKTYFKALAGCAICGYYNTCKIIIDERINSDIIDLCLSEFADFVTPETSSFPSDGSIYYKVLDILRKFRQKESLF